MDAELLSIGNLRTYFYTDLGVAKAVDGIDLTVNKGIVFGIVGESGCGKSVTALSIMRLIPQPPGKIESGEIVFEGKDLLGLKEKEVRRIRGNRISMIFQEPMTSLNIAMALSCNPSLMIADEPTTALDVTIQAQILYLMQNLKDETGTSIILITHDLAVIAENAQEVIVMYAGRVMEFAEVIDLFDSPYHPYTLGLMKSIPKPDENIKRLKTISGIVPNLYNLTKACRFSDRCDQAHGRCFESEPPLIEVKPKHLCRCWRYD